MLMEQTPSQQNWQKYNSLKRPGQMRAQSYQTLAHGADTIQFFQLRRSVGGCEKFHGAVIAHAGSENTRVFREVAQLGAELESFGDRTLGSRNEADPMKERLELVEHFYAEEAAHIGRTLRIQKGALNSILDYSLHSNLGVLKNLVQLSCAKAFLRENVAGNRTGEIAVTFSDLSFQTYNVSAETET